MRFIVEFWRVNPIVALGMTEYQWISLALVILGTRLLFYRIKFSKEEKKMAKDPVCGMKRRRTKSSGRESIPRSLILFLFEELQGKV
jgi:hypothetical protein